MRSPTRTALAMTGAVVTAAGAIWAVKDYRAWVALGKGGLPANVFGWAVASYFRLRRNDPLDVSTLADTGSGTLSDILGRNGSRPRMAAWPIPNRQLDQPIDAAMRTRLSAAFDAQADRRRDLLEYRLSHFEKRNAALTLLDAVPHRADAIKSRGEIAHMHDDGSMHMIFSEADAVAVIERGWGERHPSIGVLPALPPTYLYVYPPRDATELAVVERLLEASVTHMTA